MTAPPVPDRFSRITQDDIAALKLIAGDDNVTADDEARNKYGRDETEDLLFLPDVIVRPSTARQVSEILRHATRRHLPVTPRGGGTGLSGGALPVHGGICLPMEKFNRIIEIDRRDFQAIVEPGVITQRFQEEVEKENMFYPPDPASRGSCQIGGNLAECAGGPRAVKYGVTKDYVLGLEAVLPTGEIISTGARVLKNVSGYNLTQLLIGSEGTLAVITKVTLRLLPPPAFRKVMLVAFQSLEEAASAVSEVFSTRVIPSAMEFMERSAVKAAEEHLGRQFPNSDAEAHLLIEIDGTNAAGADGDIQAIAEAVERHSAGQIVLAEERQKIENIWDLRKSVGEAVKSISAYKEEDTVVPRSRLPELVRGVKEICGRSGVRSICYGHAGDGNVHVNILKGNLDDEAWEKCLDDTVRQIFRLTVSLGGTISGEHGIGYSQKGYLPIAVSSAELRLMRDIKTVFDPAGILNPGKIFPE